MRIFFDEIPEINVSAPCGGAGELTAKRFSGDIGEVTPCRLHPGGAIGFHRHEDGPEFVYVLFGTGTAVCDGAEEPLSTDVCHICPAGSGHSITNTGFTDLVMLVVAPKPGNER